MDKLLYTKRETAKLLSISEDTLDQLRDCINDAARRAQEYFA